MRKFWKQRREDEIAQLLRANRAEPREEFAASLLERLETKQRRFRPQRVGRRILVAAAVTALAVGAGAAAGATHVAGTSISNLVHVGSHASNGNGNGSPAQDNKTKNDPSSGDHQYAVAICHHTHSQTNPWVELFLSPQGAANHLKHHPDDFMVDSTHPCPP
jgi:hypothetical protein